MVDFWVLIGPTSGQDACGNKYYYVTEKRGRLKIVVGSCKDCQRYKYESFNGITSDLNTGLVIVRFWTSDWSDYLDMAPLGVCLLNISSKLVSGNQILIKKHIF